MTTTTTDKRTPKTKRTAKAPTIKKAKRAVKKPAIDPAWKAIVDEAADELQRLCADMDYSADDYLREKYAGVDAENAMSEQIPRFPSETATLSPSPSGLAARR